ncbi:MAG TPA: zinc ribbon domain-containing protein [Gaiellaceae bacterium]|nr:zinc ribbon domain-containing protein [Gaiellaceae bacterium]
MSSLSLECPACGESDELRGRKEGALILVHCDTCGHEWPRDPDVCPRCESRAIVDRREPMFQKARGTQQSIIAFRIIHECGRCGNEW